MQRPCSLDAYAVSLEALSIGRHNRYDIPESDFASLLDGLTTHSGGSRGPRWLSLRGDTGLIETSKEFGGAAFSRYDALVGPAVREDLMRVAAALTEYQEPDGSLRTSDTRFPVEAGLMQSTTQALQAWHQAYERSADEHYLTQRGTRFADGGTLLSLRNVAPGSTRGDVVLRLFATREDGGRTVRAAEVFRATQPSVERAMTFFWNGKRADGKAAEPAGRYIAELSFVDARGAAVQMAEVPFVHDTPEAQQAAFGEVAGALNVNGEAPAANTKVELVDDRGRVVQSTVTTTAGNYRFRNVDRGRYKVRVEKKGFLAAETDVAAAPARAAMPAPMVLQAT